jgi:putative redox protein
MPTKTATVRHLGPGLRFLVRTGSGHELVLDDAEGDAGPRPAELIVGALAGCTAMDVASILTKKRQAIDSYEVRVTGTQRDEHPRSFIAMDILHQVRGASVDPEAVRRAIELSATQYCAASATLSTGKLTIHHRYAVEGPGGWVDGEAAVTGPFGVQRLAVPPRPTGMRATARSARPSAPRTAPPS